MTDRDECKECRLVRRWAANWGAPNPTARCCQCRLQEAVDRVRELEAALSRAVDLLDECLGDTDLPDDDRPDVRAMQTLTAVLGKEVTS
jgi:hypothetical protein